MKLNSTEKIVFKGNNGEVSVETNCSEKNNVDRTSIDYSIASKIGAGPVISTKKIRSTNERRPVVKCRVCINRFEKSIGVNLADRSDKKYKALLGDDILQYFAVGDKTEEEVAVPVLKCDRVHCVYTPTRDEAHTKYKEGDMCPRCESGWLEYHGMDYRDRYIERR